MDFRGIDAKIDRARNQVIALSADIDELCANIRQAIVHEIDTDAGEQKWVYRAAAPEVPIEWSIRVGEILYNLRSVLDHLVWQLVLASGNKPTRFNQFPILDEAEEWTRASTARGLRGVSDENKEMVRNLQPFNPFLQLPVDGKYRPCNAQVFRTLRDLCNIDKHRHLNLILAVTTGIEPIVFGVNHPPRRPTAAPLEGRGRKGTIGQDMILLTFNDVEQELKPNFFIRVTFHCIKRRTLTQTSVADQLRDCLAAVQGGCTLFRPR